MKIYLWVMQCYVAIVNMITIILVGFQTIEKIRCFFLDISEWDLLHRSRIQDIQLLKMLRVKYIFDLMLENKKVKYGMR